MMPCKPVIALAFLFALCSSPAAAEDAAAPWEDLRVSLVAGKLLLDAGPSDYVKECYPEFLKPIEQRTNHFLIDQPSGLCMNHLYCAFDQCNPLAHETELGLLERWEQHTVWDLGDDAAVRDVTLKKDNPSYDLPNVVLFPEVAGDVVAAIRFAKDHGLGVSVKNSGHSYTGSSTQKDTLHINMNRYKQYAPDGLVECTKDDEIPIATDLSNQPCRLASARGKKAVLRVSGGENFDKVYRAVKAYNEKLDEYKYHLVGGAAGTVSPMGWTWQGGLSGTTAGRMFGFGVDQVLRIEMVLPNGQHVRLGPTEWEDADGFVYPKTTSVKGVCNEKPLETDESQWTWAPCSEPINFDDLWFAVRGGGGGTWGVVTSVMLQLHDYQPMAQIVFGGEAFSACGLPVLDPAYETNTKALMTTFWHFIIAFHLDPTSLGLSTKDSNRCGAPALSGTSVIEFCYGEGGGDTFANAWKDYMATHNQTLQAAGVPTQDIDTAAQCVDQFVEKQFVDYAESVLQDSLVPGKAQDEPRPAYASTTERFANVLFPTSYILENRDAMVELFVALSPSIYWAFGGDAATAQDQASALSVAHREAGMMMMVGLGDILTDNFYTNLFPAMYDTTGDNFPGFLGSNHVGPNSHGPLKSDWTKACPLEWTPSQRQAKCISIQEAVWGTQTLSRLESIKKEVDPEFMFDCYACVGNNKRSADKEAMDSKDRASATSLFQQKVRMLFYWLSGKSSGYVKASGIPVEEL